MARPVLVSLILFFALAGGSRLLHAQTLLHTERGRAFHLEHYSNTKLNPLVADGGRYIWTASAGGLARFDKLTHEDTVFWRIDSLPDPSINDIKVDRNGVLWLATPDGLVSYDGHTWSKTTFRTRSNSDASNTLKIALDSSGSMWVLSTNFFFVHTYNSEYLVHHLVGNVWTHYEESDGIVLPDNSNVVMMAAKDGSLWMGGGEGRIDSGRYGWGYVTRIFPNGQIKSWFKEDGLPYRNSAEIRAMAIDSAGGVWAVSGWGISRFDGTSWTQWEPSFAGVGYENSGASIVVDRQGIVWAGARASRFDGSHWTSYDLRTNPSYPIPHGYVRSLELGSSGDVWAATDSGASRFRGGAWINYDRTSGLSCDTVISMVPERGGEIILGTGYGVDRIAPEVGWQQYLIPNEPFANYAIAMAVDWKQNLWVVWGYQWNPDGMTLYSSLGRFDGNTWEHLDTSNGVPFATINDVTVDDRGLVWIAGYGGIASYDGSVWRTYHLDDSLVQWRDYRHIGCDSSGNIWTSSFTLQPLPSKPHYANLFVQIHKFDGSNWRTYFYDENHIQLTTGTNNYTGEVAAARNGGVYFTGSGSPQLGPWVVPLYKITGIGVVTYSIVSDSTHSISTSSIACGHDNSIWLGMSSGLKPGLLEMQAGHSTYHIDSDYTAAEVNETPHSIVVDSNDTKWCATYRAGILGFNAGQWDHIGFENGLPCNDFSLSAIAPNQDLWYQFGAYNSGGGFLKIIWDKASSSGVAESNQLSAFAVSVYPNPLVADVAHINLSGSQSGLYRITLCNTLGQRLKSASVIIQGLNTATQCDLSTSGLASGAYLLTIENGAERATAPIVKE